MDRNKQLIFQINKLMQFNVDRTLGYKKACCLVGSKHLETLFEQCITQSEHYSEKLRTAMIFHGVNLSLKPSLVGKVFRRWMGLQVLFGKNKNIAVLKSCLTAEKMLERSYQFACENYFLQYYYPLLKSTFLKQQSILQKTRKFIEYALHVEYATCLEDGYGNNNFIVKNDILPGKKS